MNASRNFAFYYGGADDGYNYDGIVSVSEADDLVSGLFCLMLTRLKIRSKERRWFVSNAKVSIKENFRVVIKCRQPHTPESETKVWFAAQLILLTPDDYSYREPQKPLRDRLDPQARNRYLKMLANVGKPARPNSRRK